MEYFTSSEQEKILEEKYLVRRNEEQDRVRECRYRGYGSQQEILEPDRIFFVEDNEKTYLGEVRESNICPDKKVEGGRVYSVDPVFISRVQEFIKRHPKYMIVFKMKKGFSNRFGVYPARMVADHEEIVLETHDVDELFFYP